MVPSVVPREDYGGRRPNALGRDAQLDLGNPSRQLV